MSIFRTVKQTGKGLPQIESAPTHLDTSENHKKSLDTQLENSCWTSRWPYVTTDWPPWRIQYVQKQIEKKTHRPQSNEKGVWLPRRRLVQTAASALHLTVIVVAQRCGAKACSPTVTYSRLHIWLQRYHVFSDMPQWHKRQIRVSAVIHHNNSQWQEYN